MTDPETPVTGREDRPHTEVQEAVIVDQPFDSDGLYALRATVAAHAARLDLPERTVDHLVIVASELAANAIRHGGGTGRLRLWRDTTAVCCQVTDHGPGIRDPHVGTAPPQRPDIGGYGLWICRQICDGLVITNADHPDHGTTVTAVLGIDGHPAPDGDGRQFRPG